MGLAIKVENLSKAYRLGQFNSASISQDIQRWFALVRGKDDPFLKIGETNDRTLKGNSEIVWSLKDLNFEVENGDTVGVIGKNGAGKSTLLKLLSRVTSPTSGTIKSKGRIASLLEVGTGFHPELTGRENIFLNGAILGMRKHEIKEQLDAIVDFAGVTRYLDTPVKRYSSGMFVRLGFAVAAHLRSEILIVDEVLAVGDAEFQKKCLGKMGEINQGEGRTILFVSHNMNSIKRLCNSGILLEYGEIVDHDGINQIIDRYVGGSMDHQFKVIASENLSSNEIVEIRSVEFLSEDKRISVSSGFKIQIKYLAKGVLPLGFTLICRDKYGGIVFSSLSEVTDKHQSKQNFKYTTQVTIDAGMLNNNYYSFDLLAYSSGYRNAITIEKIVEINIDDDTLNRGNYFGSIEGQIRPLLNWKTFED